MDGDADAAVEARIRIGWLQRLLQQCQNFSCHQVRFCVRAIHHRFANISYVRAARDDRIVGVVDECKGQSF